MTKPELSAGLSIIERRTSTEVLTEVLTSADRRTGKSFLSEEFSHTLLIVRKVADSSAKISLKRTNVNICRHRKRITPHAKQLKVNRRVVIRVAREVLQSAQRGPRSSNHIESLQVSRRQGLCACHELLYGHCPRPYFRVHKKIPIGDVYSGLLLINGFDSGRSDVN